MRRPVCNQPSPPAVGYSLTWMQSVAMASTFQRSRSSRGTSSKLRRNASRQARQVIQGTAISHTHATTHTLCATLTPPTARLTRPATSSGHGSRVGASLAYTGVNINSCLQSCGQCETHSTKAGAGGCSAEDASVVWRQDSAQD